jgi:hypothetical protein
MHGQRSKLNRQMSLVEMDCVSFLINDGVFHGPQRLAATVPEHAKGPSHSSRFGSATSSICIAFEPKENSTWRQQYQFLNSSKPGRNRNLDARRLIRRHVRNDTILRQKASSKVKPSKYRKLPDPQTVSEVNNTEGSEQDACIQGPETLRISDCAMHRWLRN